jgi:hypothetical protein
MQNCQVLGPLRYGQPGLRAACRAIDGSIVAPRPWRYGCGGGGEQAGLGDGLAQAAAGISWPLGGSGQRLEVAYLQSGHGPKDAALVQADAKSVVGIDYSATAGVAQRRPMIWGWFPCTSPRVITQQASSWPDITPQSVSGFIGQARQFDPAFCCTGLRTAQPVEKYSPAPFAGHGIIEHESEVHLHGLGGVVWEERLVTRMEEA